jgi:hypothetical protein
LVETAASGAASPNAGSKHAFARDVEKAIGILERSAESAHLLFNDVQMPPGELNGFDLARTCAEPCPHIDILVASGMVNPSQGELPEGAILSKTDGIVFYELARFGMSR